MELDGEVAVAMADNPDRGEPADREARFLPELPTGRLLRTLSGFDLPPGEFPEPAEELLWRPALDKQAIRSVGHDDHGPPDVRPPGSTPAPGQPPGVVELAERAAAIGDRALRASRAPRGADGLPELHDRLVERAGRVRAERAAELLLEAPPDGHRTEFPLFPRPAGGDPEPVRLEGHRRDAEGHRGDRPGDVRAHAGHRLEAGHGRRDTATVTGDDLPRRRVEVTGPGVVAGALPELEDPFEGSGGEGGDVGKGADEPFEVRRRLVDARLLKQYLGDPDAIGVPVLPPRERPAVGREPCQEGRDDPSARRALGGAGPVARRSPSARRSGTKERLKAAGLLVRSPRGLRRKDGVPSRSPTRPSRLRSSARRYRSSSTSTPNGAPRAGSAGRPWTSSRASSKGG